MDLTTVYRNNIYTVLFLMMRSLRGASYINEVKSVIGFDNPTTLDPKDLHNTITRDKGIEMRSSADGGAYINFPLPNPHDEWSFELEFNNPHLHYPEYAGIYLWYTDGPPEKGNFRGVDGRFVGMVAGIELLGKYVELTLGSNDGELDAAEHEDVLLLRDSINPKRFNHVSDFTIKIISTLKNIKMEIYDQDKKLIYDNLRYLKSGFLGDLRAGKHFTITTMYEKVPTYKSFILNRAQLFSRTEDEGYDPRAILSDKPSEDPRYFDLVGHENKNVQHLISNIEHFVAYMKAVIGDPIGMSLLKGMSNYSNSIKAYDESLEKVVQRLEQDLEPPAVIEEIRSKIEMAEKDLESLERIITSLRSIIENIRKRTENTIINIVVIMVLLLILLLALKLVKYVFVRLFFNERRFK